MRFRGIACALGIASALLASACGGSEHAAPLPKKSVAVSASTTPAAMAQQVEAAVRHYYDVANQAFRTGDTTELESLSAPGCNCRKLARSIQRVAAHGRYDGLVMTISQLKLRDLHGEVALVSAVVAGTSYRELAANGHVLATYEAHSASEDLSLAASHGSWIVERVVLTQVN